MKQPFFSLLFFSLTCSYSNGSVISCFIISFLSLSLTFYLLFVPFLGPAGTRRPCRSPHPHPTSGVPDHALTGGQGTGTKKADYGRTEFGPRRSRKGKAENKINPVASSACPAMRVEFDGASSNSFIYAGISRVVRKHHFPVCRWRLPHPAEARADIANLFLPWVIRLRFLHLVARPQRPREPTPGSKSEDRE